MAGRILLDKLPRLAFMDRSCSKRHCGDLWPAAVLIWLSLYGALAGPSIAVATHYNGATVAIPASDRYFYRRITRANAIAPSSLFTDNFGPVSVRELWNAYGTLDATSLEGRRVFGRLWHFYMPSQPCEPGRSEVVPLAAINSDSLYSSESDFRVPSNFGERSPGAAYATLSGLGNARLKDRLAMSYEFRAKSYQHTGEADLYRFAIKTAFAHQSLSFGKESTVLGPGRFGNLILSDNVAPQNTAMLQTETPYDWGSLGAFRWYVWHIWYDDTQRSTPDPSLLGARLSLKPAPFLELGVSRTSLYGGEGDSISGFDDLWLVLTAEDENDPDGKLNTDQILGIDVSVYLPWIKRWTPFKGAKVYTERVWNDLAARWQGDDVSFVDLLDPSSLYGLFLTTGRVDVTLEYAHTSENIYTHGVLGTEGVTNDGFVIGHRIGRDAQGLFGEVYYELDRDFHVFSSGGYIKRGLTTKDVQAYKEFGFGARLFFTPSLQASFSANYLWRNKTDTNPQPVYYAFDGPSRSNSYVTVNARKYFP